MMCNAQPRTHFPVVIQSDVGFIIIMALFGLSNGYISNVCFTAAPKYVSFDYYQISDVDALTNDEVVKFSYLSFDIDIYHKSPNYYLLFIYLCYLSMLLELFLACLLLDFV